VAKFFIKLDDQIMFWFNQLMGSNLVLFQVIMMAQLAT